jgi:1-pyrroline-5-carboxylate dehydrogenase
MTMASSIPSPVNEPVRSYAPGSPERAGLKTRLAAMAGDVADIPVVVGGREHRTGAAASVVMPHDHQHVLGQVQQATPELVRRAIDAAAIAHRDWSARSYEERAAVFLKAADLLAGSWRDTLNAATMLGQSKTAYQAEIDSACETIDFFRFNAAFGAALHSEQPISPPGITNQMEYRPLEGFVYAVTPFNFTAIAANLPTAPVLMGNTVLWKPAATAMLSAHYLMKLLDAAGLPPGVINMVPGDAVMISEIALGHRDFAGLHFTGSTAVFNSMWKTIGASTNTYRSYPRIVGETGGKDFILAHPSADLDALLTAIVRGAFEFQGQKCSAASRIYIPGSMWPALRDRLVATIDAVAVGDVRDFRNFMGAVIDRRAFDRINAYLEYARFNATIVAGGKTDASTGYFIRPTLVTTTDPSFKLLEEEIFGPVVTAYVYNDRRWEETLELVDRTSPYALTGAVIAQDADAVREARTALRYAAGNFYINDKPTGAVVGQQPFGGARASGTNDKAGSPLNLTRWVSARTIKETHDPPRDYRYPFMEAE